MSANISALLEKLKSLATPQSAMSQAGNMDAYNQHVMQAQIQGQQPMTFEQFQQMMQGQPQQQQPGLIGQ